MGRKATPVGSHGKINVTQKADGQFRAETRIKEPDGSSTRIARYGKTAAAAERALKAAILEWKPKEAGPAVDVPTIAELVEDFYRFGIRNAAWSDTTVETYRSTKNSLIIPLLGDLPINKLTTPVVNRTLMQVHAATPGRVKTLKAMLSGLARYAVHLGYLDANPVRDTIHLAEPTHRRDGKPRGPRILTQEELDRLRDVAARYDRGEFWTSGPRNLNQMSPIIEIGFALAGRIGEALSLCWEDIDGLDHPRDDGTVRVTIWKTAVRASRERALYLGEPWEGAYKVQERTKTGVKRRVTLGPSTIELLRSLPRTSPFVLPNRNGGMQTHDSVGKRMRKLIRLAGLDEPDRTNVSFHALRRTVATRVAREFGIEAGAAAVGDDPVVAKKHYIVNEIDVPDFSRFIA